MWHCDPSSEQEWRTSPRDRFCRGIPHIAAHSEHVRGGPQGTLFGPSFRARFPTAIGAQSYVRAMVEDGRRRAAPSPMPFSFRNPPLQVRNPSNEPRAIIYRITDAGFTGHRP